MPPAKGPRAQTTGSSKFDPDVFFENWAKNGNTLLPQNNDLRTSIISAFNLAQSDNYVYHAIASVTLAQVQEAIDHGAENGMHAWYPDETGKSTEQSVPPPSAADIAAYTSIFASTTSTPKALTAFAANAKKGSHRAAAATYLQSKRFLPTAPNNPPKNNNSNNNNTATTTYTTPKLKTPHTNPYLDYWTWTCQTLSWTGPTPATVHIKHSHAILPILMHHFGCVCPTYESLHLLITLARGRKIIDLGSGNGYWTYMLRRMGAEVEAVDNLQSRYRTCWVGDTVVEEGESYLLRRRGGEGEGKGCVLLLVYPIVGGGGFTRRVLEAFGGGMVCVVGTQNGNGYTGFAGRVIDEWMAERGGWVKKAQVALPSFAGKDEALFVFEREEVVDEEETKEKEKEKEKETEKEKEKETEKEK
ncbi:MAG: hypothetical protein LQ350_007709 [Teloschistes chrysophthalmus]|nr:MAG: hypothetical protein LQ350_007709 [Niorma chrysophthalma]